MIVQYGRKWARGNSGRKCFFELAWKISHGRPTFSGRFAIEPNTVDGGVSLEVSPLLARDTENSLRAAKGLFARAQRTNLFIKIPGTREGLPAIEEAILRECRSM
jgi:transaldolase